MSGEVRGRGEEELERRVGVSLGTYGDSTEHHQRLRPLSPKPALDG